MSTYIRLKRKLNQSSSDELLLRTKRSRLDDESTETIFELAASSVSSDLTEISNIRTFKRSRECTEKDDDQYIRKKMRKLAINDRKDISYRITETKREQMADASGDLLVIEAENDVEEDTNESNYVYDIFVPRDNFDNAGFENLYSNVYDEIYDENVEDENILELSSDEENPCWDDYYKEDTEEFESTSCDSQNSTNSEFSYKRVNRKRYEYGYFFNAHDDSDYDNYYEHEANDNENDDDDDNDNDNYDDDDDDD